MSPDDKAMHQQFFFDDLLPELLLRIFMKEFHLDREQALQQITDQEEKRVLFNESIAE
jgi:hypothetical protein